MVPPDLVEKWAREAFLTLPGLHVFLIDDLRNGATRINPRSKRGAIETGPHRAGRVTDDIERVAVTQGFVEFQEALVVALRETIPVYCRP
jgi:hypothetical protein